jgi:hypothetical protein
VAYIRTSSAANVGADKDSEQRQRAAITGLAKRVGFTLVTEYNDAASLPCQPIAQKTAHARLCSTHCWRTLLPPTSRAKALLVGLSSLILANARYGPRRDCGSTLDLAGIRRSILKVRH